MIRFVILVFTLGAVFSCSNPKSSNTKQVNQISKEVSQPLYKSLAVTITQETEHLILGSPVQLKWENPVDVIPDSVRITLNSVFWKKLIAVEPIINLEIDKAVLGKNQASFTFYWGDTLLASKNLTLVYYSDSKPEQLTYKIVESYPHNIHSYTQGLEFSDGFLYEGTGQYGESKLYKIDLEKNEVLQSLNLSSDVFGEGITVFNDKIYQLTWRSQVGFVYHKNDLSTLYEFNYPTEGWGLCNNGKELIMSDGSEIIYFLDTDYMQEIRRIQVYNDKEPVMNLNELEYINGVIYANVYGSDFIVTIDPETGRVLSKVDLSGILNKKDITRPVDVLNGIAYNPKENKLLVTGKYWPKMYAISLHKK
jgi:glutamine cyclotransferase